MILRESNCNNYIVLIEKYLETIQFDGLVVETSKRRRILYYRIQWLQPKITSCKTCLHLRCQISVPNGVFSTPHGPLILVKLMSICNLTPLISVCWQQLPDVIPWSITWIFSLYQIWSENVLNSLTKLSCRRHMNIIISGFCTGLLTADVRIFV